MPDDKPLDRTVGYFVSVTVVAIVAITIITLLTASFSAYLDFGAGVAFVIAPIIASPQSPDGVQDACLRSSTPPRF